MREEEEGFSLGKRIFLTRGGILDRLELSRFVGHEEDVPRIDGTSGACVCVVGRILRNPSLTAASFLKRSLARRRGVDLAARERRSKFLEAIVKIRLSANFTAVLSATLRAGAYFNRAL